jgi:UDP-GlcNAc:undecaprenyl-phosphate GlcNAc-1-phosphate transferase
MVFIIVFFTSLLVVAFAIPQIITIALLKHLFDEPVGFRKVHKQTVPNFGGIAIFFGFFFTVNLVSHTRMLAEMNIFTSASLVIFLVGLKDDIVGLSPSLKFVGQFLCALIITVIGDLRFSNLDGILGIYQIAYIPSVVLSVLFIVGIVNSFNLIDGIDGLAGTLTIIVTLFFSYLFYTQGQPGWACLSLSLAGATSGFLYYNITPAKIFMGDSGSLFIGLTASLMSLKFINLNLSSITSIGTVQITAPIALVGAILIIPIFDTLRVFTLRILKNSSPFMADNNHLHHRLLFLGLTHIQATLILAVINVVFIIGALSLQSMGDNQILLILILAALVANSILSVVIERHKKSISVNAKNNEAIVYDLAGNPTADEDTGKNIFQKVSKN